MTQTATLSQEAYVKLYKGNIIPLRVCLAGLTWVLHDYFVTLEDEYQRNSLSKYLYLWLRYYTIFLVAFDTVQIHTFSLPGVATNTMCVVIAPITRILGAISLWTVEIIMQLRLYALFNRSKKIAAVNGILFIASIGIFLWMLVVNAMRRGQMIASATRLPLPGCPAINGGTEWALWLSPMSYEFILFFSVIYKGLSSISARMRLNERLTLTAVLLQENTLYFLSVALLLLFNNLMVIGATKIPWFGYAPFHAAIGIVTCRMLVHLRKFTEHKLFDNASASTDVETTRISHNGPLRFLKSGERSNVDAEEDRNVAAQDPYLDKKIFTEGSLDPFSCETSFM